MDGERYRGKELRREGERCGGRERWGEGEVRRERGEERERYGGREVRRGRQECCHTCRRWCAFDMILEGWAAMFNWCCCAVACAEEGPVWPAVVNCRSGLTVGCMWLAGTWWVGRRGWTHGHGICRLVQTFWFGTAFGSCGLTKNGCAAHIGGMG